MLTRRIYHMDVVKAYPPPSPDTYEPDTTNICLRFPPGGDWFWTGKIWTQHEPQEPQLRWVAEPKLGYCIAPQGVNPDGRLVACLAVAKTLTYKQAHDRDISFGPNYQLEVIKDQLGYLVLDTDLGEIMGGIQPGNAILNTKDYE